jgi:cytochrome P450
MKVVPKNGSTFDIQDFFSYLMMDIATDVFLGESANVLSSASPTSCTSLGRTFAQAFEYASLAVCGRGQIDLYEIISKLFGDRKLKESFRIIDSFLDRVIRNAQQRSKRTDINEKSCEATFLEELVKDTQDSQRIKHDILNLLLAGKDTVTAAVSNTWFVLAKRPDVYAKLRAEIAILKGQRPSGQQLKDLKYLRYVLNECKFASQAHYFIYFPAIID